MKKVLTLVLLVAMCCSCLVFVSSCDNSSETITIRVLENDMAKKSGYLQVLLDEFNKKYASEKVVAVDADMDEYSDLENDGPYGYGPDVLYQANDILMKIQ